MYLDDLDIIILTCKRKKSLTSERLKLQNISYIEYDNIDWPEDYSKVKSEYKTLGVCSGPLRCTLGHKEMLKLGNRPYILALEDDCDFKYDWLNTVLSAAKYLDNHFDLISLHSREYTPDYFLSPRINEENYNFYIPNFSQRSSELMIRWALGSLAYLVKRDNPAHKSITNQDYIGIPQDLFNINLQNSVILEPSPFIHDRSEGSLVDESAKGR